MLANLCCYDEWRIRDSTAVSQKFVLDCKLRFRLPFLAATIAFQQPSKQKTRLAAGFFIRDSA